MRRPGTWNEDDSIVTRFCRNSFGAAEVTMMNRIETPAEVERWHKTAAPSVMAMTQWVARGRTLPEQGDIRVCYP